VQICNLCNPLWVNITVLDHLICVPID
jgi:hypothetical protein